MKHNIISYLQMIIKKIAPTICVIKPLFFEKKFFLKRINFKISNQKLSEVLLVHGQENIYKSDHRRNYPRLC
jgi:hypothetical protein